MKIELRFMAGTLEVHGPGPDVAWLPECVWDERTACHRAPASAYATVVRALIARKLDYDDQARRYPDLETVPRYRREPRPFQREALDAWTAAGGRGVVVLPTGAGKTQVALMAIAVRKRSALVVCPTLDLVRQWHDRLDAMFGGPIGVVGGGSHEVAPLTVTTYSSAYLHMENFGARFGLAVFDECHHLPGPSFALAAQMCLAPFRLGLTATPEDQEGGTERLEQLIGPIVYRREIDVLSGDWLAEYETQRLVVDLSAAQRTEYDAQRAIYREFVVSQGIRMSSPGGWAEFIMRSSLTDHGRAALAAYRRQKEISEAADAKITVVEGLLHTHRHDRAIIFTKSNKTAYAIARRFLVPVITHKTKVRERSEILKGLNGDLYGVVVTSRVLNEGVDVPEANVAVVVSGSGTVREHVQRLGRILRKREGKRAVLYELVTGDTGETYTSERRRQHVAYR